MWYVTFALSEQGRAIYHLIKDGIIQIPLFEDMTSLQQHFLIISASKKVHYEETIDLRLKAIAEALGVEFKEKRG